MTTIPSFIGTAVAVVQAAPATYDGAGYAALTWTAAVGNIVDMGPIGDASTDIPVTTLAGRTLHTNGARDGGEVPITFVYNETDAGQVILRAQSNTNNPVSVRVTDPDGDIAYFTCVVASVQDVQRSADAYKGQTAALRINTAVVRA